MNTSFKGVSPFLSQMESAIDWLGENISWVPSIEDQSCNHTTQNGTNISSAEWGGPTGSVRRWLGGNPHIMAKIVLTFAYAVIIVISLFGNSLVCQVFVKHKEIKKSTGLLIFNLAISDILIILLNSPFALARFLSGQWVFGRIMCHVSRFAQYCSLHVSTLTLMAVAMDRHRVILHPMKPRLTHSQCLFVVAMIWSIAVFLALPHAIYQNLFTLVNMDGDTRSYCLPSFPGPSILVSNADRYTAEKTMKIFKKRLLDVSHWTSFYCLFRLLEMRLDRTLLRRRAFQSRDRDTSRILGD